MTAEQPAHITLSDVIDDLSDAQIRRLVALLGLAEPQQPEHEQQRTAA